MSVNDYLQGINNATSGEKTDVRTATDQLSTYQAGAGSLPDKLKEALNTKLNNNKDIIDQQSATMENYFNSGANARAKYQDVWNPFEKAKLVQQERSMALRPYDTLSGVLENRMGTVADVVNAGVSGWKGLVDSATTKLDSAKSMLSTALQSYLSASSQQQAADDMAFKIAQAEEASRQFEKNYGLESTKVTNQASQFDRELAAKMAIAKLGSGGGNRQKDLSEATNAISETIRSIVGDGSAANLQKAWQYISGNQASWDAQGINTQRDIWPVYTAHGGSSTPVTGSKANGFLSNFFTGNSNYANSQADLSGYNLKLR